MAPDPKSIYRPYGETVSSSSLQQCSCGYPGHTCLGNRDDCPLGTNPRAPSKSIAAPSVQPSAECEWPECGCKDGALCELMIPQRPSEKLQLTVDGDAIFEAVAEKFKDYPLAVQAVQECKDRMLAATPPVAAQSASGALSETVKAQDTVLSLIYEMVGAPEDAPIGDLPGYVKAATDNGAKK